MKSQKGITLISLTIYIVGMTIVIGIMATMTTFFYSNIKDVNQDIDPLTEYTTFNTYFSEEVNHQNLKIEKCENDYIIFSNNIQYIYNSNNKAIYRVDPNKIQNEDEKKDKIVKICRNVDDCSFSEKIENGKTVINVYFKAGQTDKTATYILGN